MPRRISFTRLNEDKEIYRIFNDNQSTESNAEVRLLAKKAMKKIIEEQLTARQKQILVLYYFEDIDMPAISEMLSELTNIVKKGDGASSPNSTGKCITPSPAYAALKYPNIFLSPDL